MTIYELFERLSYGELSNLSIGVDGSGTIEESAHRKLVQHINDGLLQLYTKFPLCTKEIVVEMVEGITNYHLRPMYAESQWDSEEVPYPYIKDLAGEPYTGDLIKVIEVYDKEGNLPLNDIEQEYSVFTPVFNVLQVPHVRDYESLTISYQAKHKKLSADKLDDIIELPDILVEALAAYVGYKVYTFMNGVEATGKANEHLSNFYRLCDEAVANDLVSSSISTTTVRFSLGGWV